MKETDKNRTPLSLRITLIVMIICTGVVILTLAILRSIQNNMVFYSRYTYVREYPLHATDSMTPQEEADSWIRGFLNQFEGTLVPTHERLKKVSIDSIELADPKNDTVRIKFSAALTDAGSDYFSEWNPQFSDGLMICDWTVKLGVETTAGNRDGIYVISMVDNENGSVDPQPDTPKQEEDNLFTEYRIDNGQLSVSFDGGDLFVSVPVDIRNLPFAADGDSLESGSYYLSRESAAFLSGGAMVNGEKIPVSVVYTKDKGETWKTSEVDGIFDASYYYIRMFNENEGVITVGYAATATEEFSKIFYTMDGASSWQAKGSGPLNIPLTGVNFLDRDTAFFSYIYNANNTSNLFVTRDEAATFNPVLLPAQQPDADAGDRKWEEIYKQATVPQYNANGELEVLLTQGADGTYHNGMTAARYTSVDKGVNWKYEEQTTFITEGI